MIYCCYHEETQLNFQHLSYKLLITVTIIIIIIIVIITFIIWLFTTGFPCVAMALSVLKLAL